MRRSAVVCTILSFLATSIAHAQRAAPFRLEEATIDDVRAALKAGSITCHALVQRYLDRIDAYDKKGPALNAIVLVNPTALTDADDLDRRFRQSGFVGALHCIPTIVKDNYQTAGLQTTGGSLSLKGWLPAADATVVKRMRDAGAVILAKSNMAEFAFSPLETISSILPGYTRNAYALDRVTAGSSGGTADAVAANFGSVGLGTDTGNSIRGPSAFLALVGIRPTMGLTSRAGVVPLFLNADVTGPMTRTVADAAAVLQVIAGPDAADSATARAEGKVPASYASSLVRDALKGARIGVLHQAYDRPSADTEMVSLFKRSLDEMRAAGAVIIDPVAVDSLDALFRIQSGGCSVFKADLNRFLAGAGPNVPMHSLDEVIKSRQFHPSIEKRLLDAQAIADSPEQTPACKSREEFRARLRVAVLALMDKNSLDALVYPTWSNPQRLIGDLNTVGGDNNQLFSPSTGFPAMTVPMGWLRGGVLPAGVQFFGRPWSEAKLIGLAYSYEQATHHRHAPPSVPPLVTKGQ